MECKSNICDLHRVTLRVTTLIPAILLQPTYPKQSTIYTNPSPPPPFSNKYNICSWLEEHCSELQSTTNTARKAAHGIQNNPPFLLMRRRTYVQQRTTEIMAVVSDYTLQRFWYLIYRFLTSFLFRKHSDAVSHEEHGKIPMLSKTTWIFKRLSGLLLSYMWAQIFKRDHMFS